MSKFLISLSGMFMMAGSFFAETLNQTKVTIVISGSILIFAGITR